MPTVLKDQVFEKADRLLDNIEQQLNLFKSAPSIAPAQHHYTFENGALYAEPTKSEATFIPDRGFDAPA